MSFLPGLFKMFWPTVLTNDGLGSRSGFRRNFIIQFKNRGKMYKYKLSIEKYLGQNLVQWIGFQNGVMILIT